jgi:hypothetical protein
MHLILIALIFGIFFAASANKVNSRAVKQQVLEKQLALLIDSAEPGTDFYIKKININKQIDKIDKIEIKEGRIFAYVNGQSFSKGYPYFSKHSVSVEFVKAEKDLDSKFLIKII